jgi:hypothetical protein
VMPNRDQHGKPLQLCRPDEQTGEAPCVVVSGYPVSGSKPILAVHAEPAGVTFAHPPTLAVGERVEVHGLAVDRQYNGQIGVVLELPRHSPLGGALRVQLDSNRKPISVMPGSLRSLKPQPQPQPQPQPRPQSPALTPPVAAIMRRAPVRASDETADLPAVQRSAVLDRRASVPAQDMER